jgi:hypothetical protein
VNTQCGREAPRSEGLKGMLGVKDRRTKKGNAIMYKTKRFKTHMNGF